MWDWRKINVWNFIWRSTFTKNPERSTLTPKGAPRNNALREGWTGNLVQTLTCSRGLNPVPGALLVTQKSQPPHLRVRLIQKGILMTVEFPKTCRSKTCCYLGMHGQLTKSIRHWINSAFVILALILVTAEPNLNAPQRVLHWWQFRTSRLYFKCLC